MVTRTRLTVMLDARCLSCYIDSHVVQFTAKYNHYIICNLYITPDTFPTTLLSTWVSSGCRQYLPCFLTSYNTCWCVVSLQRPCRVLPSDGICHNNMWQQTYGRRTDERVAQNRTEYKKRSSRISEQCQLLSVPITFVCFSNLYFTLRELWLEVNAGKTKYMVMYRNKNAGRSHDIYIYIYIYTGCPRRNVPDFGRVFLMLKYTDITQNTYVQS